MIAVNSILNRIHEWNAPDRSFLTHLLLTRMGGTACAVAEISAIAIVSLQAVHKACSNVFDVTKKVFRVIFFRPKKKESNTTETFSQKFINICKLIVGLFSTIFFGVIFSPTNNFKLHLKLGLAVDNLAARKEREQAAKLQLELKKIEVERERAQRFAHFQEDRQAKKAAKEQENAINPLLAEALMSGASAASFGVR